MGQASPDTEAFCATCRVSSRVQTGQANRPCRCCTCFYPCNCFCAVASWHQRQSLSLMGSYLATPNRHKVYRNHVQAGRGWHMLLRVRQTPAFARAKAHHIDSSQLLKCHAFDKIRINQPIRTFCQHLRGALIFLVAGWHHQIVSRE